MQRNAIRSFNQHSPQLGHEVMIDPSAVVSGQVSLGDDASIWPCASVRGDLEPIIIGARSNIQDGAVLHTSHHSPFNDRAYALTIGNDVTIGHNVTLHGCTIKDLCLVGMNAVILDGALIPPYTFIGAHSLVTAGKQLESGFLYAGSPAKKIRQLTEQECDFFHYSAAHYVSLKNQHLAQ